MGENKGSAELLEKLWQDTRTPPPEIVQQVDKGAFKADFVGHADVTDLLLAHDPCFTWEPMARDEHGLPLSTIDVNGNPALWIWLTVHGVTKPGVGTCLKSAREPLKELIGDAIRNASMRFGVALSLWSKLERGDTAMATSSAPAPAVEAITDDHAQLVEKVKDLSPANRKALQAWMVEQKMSSKIAELDIDTIAKITNKIVDEGWLQKAETPAS